MIDIFKYIEDFDNPVLEFPEWLEQMVEAVKDYNIEHGTTYDPANIISRHQWGKDYDKWNGYEIS